jgi:hypothetical protein
MSKQVANGGVGFVGLLTLLFITLKLTHVIDWSWWWVLSPIWINIILGIILILIIVAIAILRTRRDVNPISNDKRSI